MQRNPASLQLLSKTEQVCICALTIVHGKYACSDDVAVSWSVNQDHAAHLESAHHGHI